MISLIDADSLIWIIAYNHQENSGDETAVKQSCDSFIRDILALSGCDSYIASFSAKDNFRHRNYKYAPYKGNRPERPEFMALWGQRITDHFINKHGFIVPVDLEADDVIMALVHLLGTENVVICSPDKDLKQVAGTFYDYKKQSAIEESFIPKLEIVTKEQAHYNFWLQMVMGDTSDNVKSIPGLGEVKAKALLDSALDPMQYASVVLQAYQKYFGTYYGEIIFKETAEALMLIRPEHRYWIHYLPELKYIANNSIRQLNTGTSIFDV